MEGIKFGGSRDSGTSNVDSSLPALSAARKHLDEQYNSQECDPGNCTSIPPQLIKMIIADKKNIHRDFSRGNIFWTLFGEKSLKDVHRGGVWVKMF